MAHGRKTRPIPRRQFLKLLTGAAGGATLLSWAPVVRAGTRTDKRVHLLQRAPFVPAGDKLMKQQAGEWGRANGVEVTIENVNIQDLQTRTASAIETKAGADIVQFMGNWAWLYAPALVDMTKAAEAYQKQYGKYYPSIEQVSKVNGAWRALPYSYVSNVVVYRKDWLAEVGHPEPKTWDEWREAGKKLKPKNRPIGLAVSHAVGDGPGNCYPLFWSWGCKETEADGKTVAINSKETLDCVQWVVGFYKDALDDAALAYDDTSNNKNYLGGTVSMVINSPSVTVKAKEDFPDIYKQTWHAGFPAGPAGAAAWELNLSHGIMSYSKNRDAAEAFLLWLMEPKQYEAWMMACGGTNAGPTAYFEKAAVWTSEPILTALKDIPKTVRHYGYPGPATRAAAESVSKFIVVDMLAKACQGMAPKDAITWAERELRGIYAQQ